MKLKQFITTLVLLFANIFLLAHSVLPHTHHEGLICFSTNHICNCHDNILSDHYDACCNSFHEDTHHHHDQKGTADCDLKDLIFRQDNNSVLNTLSQDWQHVSLLYYIAVLTNSFYIDIFEVGQKIQIRPYLNNIYISPYVASNLSLRAPPTSLFS